MAINYVQVPPQSTGLKVDTTELSNGSSTVERQNICISDPSTYGQVAGVTASNALQVDLAASGAIPLPTGAATAAKQPSLGTAGSASANVITVQGIASMTKLLVTPDSVALPNHQSTNVDQIGGASLALGSTTGSASVPVVIASDQGTLAVKAAAATSGGASIYHVVSAGSTNAANIKGSAGQVYGWSIFNNAGYPVYIKFYNNTNSPPVPGTDTVVKTVGCQAGVSVEGSIVAGLVFGTGIGIAIVKGIADANATAILASDCVVDIYYK